MKYLILLTIFSSCNTIKHNKITHHIDYKLNITDSGTYVFQKKRLIGFLEFDSTQTIDKLFLKDNQ